MAKSQKKGVNTGRNPDRRNGKAWKKNAGDKARVRTPERQLKDAQIKAARQNRMLANIERREAEAAAAAELEAMRAAELELQLEQTPRGVAKRAKGLVAA